MNFKFILLKLNQFTRIEPSREKEINDIPKLHFSYRTMRSIYYIMSI